MGHARESVLVLTVGCLAGCPFEPPPDTDEGGSSDTGMEEPIETVNDGMGSGIIQTLRLKDGETAVASNAVVIGTPHESWEGVENSGQVSVLIDNKLDGLMVPANIPSTVVEDTHAGVCETGQEFAWDLLPNRRLGGALTFYNQEAGDSFEDHESSFMASSPTAGNNSGRVMNHFACDSCAIFPKPQGSLGGTDPTNLEGGHFGAAIAVGFFGEPDIVHPLGVEHLVVGAPRLSETGRVFILAESVFRFWNYPFPGSISNGGLAGNRECQCGWGDFGQGNVDCLPFTSTLEGVFPHEEFGASLGVADFDCDGLDDLAVGAPGAWLPTMDEPIEGAGAVYVYFAEPGIDPAAPQDLRQGQFEVGGDPETDDRFGAVLGVGNFNGMRRLNNDRSCFDLVVATPDEDGGTGQIQVFEGSPTGLTFGGPIIELADIFDAAGDPGDRFGAALVAGDFNGDGFDDLVVGAPGDNLGGSVVIIPGSPDGLAVELASRYSQGDEGVEGANEIADEFGAALTWVRYGTASHTPHNGLVVGVPGENDEVGRIHVLEISVSNGTPMMLTTTAIFSQADILGDLARGDRFGETLIAPRAMVERPW